MRWRQGVGAHGRSTWRTVVDHAVFGRIGGGDEFLHVTLTPVADGSSVAVTFIRPDQLWGLAQESLVEVIGWPAPGHMIGVVVDEIVVLAVEACEAK
jgi:hypothetical protein